MKKTFLSHKKKKKKSKKLFFLFMVLIGVIISYQRLEKSSLTITDKDFVQLITETAFTEYKPSLLEKLVDKALEVSNPIRQMNQDYTKYLQSSKEEAVVEEKKAPLIYLYNTHQTEEYASSTYAEFSINPTVQMNDYILQDVFQKNGYETIVEESSIKEILNQNNWNYTASYQASRILLEESILKYPSLKYFIDIHRDSLTKEKTTVSIGDKSYAKILFIVGMENENYQENLAFTEKIDNKLKEYYPNLSKGIYRKSGAGVNGVYNQDFSGNTILIEIGGYENTTTEVLNSTLAFSKCFMEVLHE